MNHRIETLAVHAGQDPDPTTGAQAAPIYQTVAYAFESTEAAADVFALRAPGNIYSRITNPTQAMLEERVNAMEGGVGALATATGAAAITYALLTVTGSGDNVVAMSTLYGGTFALLTHTLPQFGIEARIVDPDHPERLADVVDERTRCVFAEVLPNPSLNVVDLDAWSAAAHAQGLPLIVDNTLPTPFLCQPFSHGVDISVHSATKYLGGHGTALGGVIVDSGNFDWAAHCDRFGIMTTPDSSYHNTVWVDAAGPAAYITRARTVLLRNMGATISPFNAWLILQGIESLPVRYERHCTNALAVARHLEAHPDVTWVNYPGLESNNYHQVAGRIFEWDGYGGLLSFGLRGGRNAGAQFIDHLQLLQHVANIGDAKSLAIHSASTTHSQLNDSELAAAGVPPEMVRLSIGLEHIDDILADIDQAIEQAH